MCPISTSKFVEVFTTLNLDYCRFIVEHNEGIGMVVKAPFVTNGKHYLFTRLKSAQDIVDSIVTIRNQINDKPGCYPVPYVMVQPCMLNRTEKKIVCVGGRYCYTLHPKCGALGHEYRYNGDMEARYEQFAEEAIFLLKQRMPECILDGLVRVDIFETTRNDERGEPIWVVNEFESLEAVFECSHADKKANVCQQLTHYWAAKLTDLIRRAGFN